MRAVHADQVGFVTVICAMCFTIRAVIVAWSALDKKDADLDVWRHPLLDIIYYSLVEIVPSALVLFILRKLVGGPVVIMPCAGCCA
jgi:Protein of unknown function (DUF1084)